MKIKRLKANITQVNTSNGISTLFFGSMAVAARMKDGRYIVPEGDLLSTAKDEAVNWWVARNVRYKQEIQTVNTTVFDTLIEGI
jgi:hypothetical protein|tara:strand:- start:1401 stop:1652 length:252 start_codon:yes stop_codon:yes gene_type:complete